MTAIRGEHRADGAVLRPGGPRMTMVAMACAAFTAAIGLVALIGWAWEMPLLTRLYATGSAMQPVTAICALLGATVVGLIARQPHRVGPACLVALLLLGSAAQTLAEHWTGWVSGVDRWFFPDAVGRQAGYYAHPGRMAEPTALAFALVAVALLSIRWRGRGARLVLSVCATIVLLLVTVALLSHLFGAGPLDGVLGFTQMSVPTACALGGLAVGTMALRPGGSWVALLTGDSVGAAAARWLLPVVVLVPVGVTALALRGTEAGLYPATFRTAFTTAVTVILLAALALWGTRQLDGLVAERRIAEALRESEATLRAFFDTDGLFASIIERRDGTYRYLAANAALAHLFDRDGLAGVALDDVGSAQANRDLVDRLGRVEASGRPDRMEMAYAASAGPRWFMITVSPIAASPRATPRFATAAVDITERKRAEARQTLLLDELNHRVKNTLAVVQSLAQQSFRGDQATPEARAAFEARLAAVAAAHHQLVRQDWRSASLAVLVEDVAGPGCGAERDRITAEGPDVLLPPPIAVSLALAFHELCTNAVKYGALANAEGRVTIAWHVEEGSRLRIVWTERGGPPVVAPTSRGFGSRLIERALSADLGGPVALHFAPEGLCCTITAEIPPLPG